MNTPSSGERQRISIARALLVGKTVLMIAHRMYTVSGADKIIVFKNGTVAEQDNPEEILQNESSLFRHMAEHQSVGAVWPIKATP